MWGKDSAQLVQVTAEALCSGLRCELEVASVFAQQIRSDMNETIFREDLGRNGTDSSGNSSLTAMGYSAELFPGAEIIQFVLLTIPTIVLCIMTMTAIVLSKNIDFKLKAILLNIFAAELFFSVGVALVLLGHRIRLLINDRPADLVVTLCKVTISIIISGGLAKILSVVLYSITIYIFIRKNIRKIKLYIIVIPLVLIWIFSTGFSIRIFTLSFVIPRAYVYRGFCSVDLENVNDSGTGFLIQLAVTWVLQGFICGGIILTFSILIFCYIKKGTLESSDQLKKSIAKNLLYLSGGAFFTITNATVLPTVLRFISFQPDINNIESAITQLVVSHFILQILRSISSIYIPLVTITLLKMVRRALKQCLLPQIHTKVAPQPQSQSDSHTFKATVS